MPHVFVRQAKVLFAAVCIGSAANGGSLQRKSMKLITFAVPSYNSQDYLKNCIESLLPGGDEVEIIIVDDGSTDSTGAIADEYQSRYPGIVRAVHKPNGGHGSGVNKGLECACGLYYKVVDSDDRVDGEAYAALLKTIREHVAEGVEADLYIVNFVYEHTNDGTSYVSNYVKNFPQNKFFGWEDIKPLRLWKMLLMHSLVYKTGNLRESGTVLPEHTFYVDNYFAYRPLPYMRRLYYLNVDFYRYYIGRSDQSVNIDNVVKRYDNQIRCMNCMLSSYTYGEIEAMCRPLKKLMYHILHVIMCNTYFFTTAKDSPERRKLFKEMWDGLRSRDKKLYRRLKRMPSFVFLGMLPWRGKGAVTTASYKFLCKHVKLG